MSSFSVTFSFDSDQEALLSALTQRLKIITNQPTSPHSTQGAPPSLSELAAAHGEAGSGMAMAGAPPSLSELAAAHGKAGSGMAMAGAPPSLAEMEAGSGKHVK